MNKISKRFFLIVMLCLVPLFAYSARLTPQFVRGSQKSVEDFLRSVAPQGSELVNFSYSIVQIQGQPMLIGVYWRGLGFDVDGNLLNGKDNKTNVYSQYAFALIPKNNSTSQYIRVPIMGFAEKEGKASGVLAVFKASLIAKADPNLIFLNSWYSAGQGHNVVYAVNFHPPFSFTQFNLPVIAKLGSDGVQNVADIKEKLVSMGIPQSNHSPVATIPADAYSIFSTFTRNSQQSVHDFLVSAAPQGSQLKNFSSSVMQVQGQQMLVSVYERLGDDDGNGGHLGGFSDSGNIFPSNADVGLNNRQYAFAFIQKKDLSSQYVRVPITGFFDDGGSPTKVIAIFKASFAKKTEPKLAFLTTWDSSIAGGHLAMDKPGIEYDVFAVNLQPSLTFTKLNTPTINKLGGCDCATTDQNDNANNQTAKAHNVAEIMKQLASMGISQPAK